MNKKDRARAQKAINEGRYAFMMGLPVSANPYKVSPWGVGGAWNVGYSDAMHEHKRNEWEKLFSRMLLCQMGFDLATFRGIAGEKVLNHLYTLYPDDITTLLEDFDFTTPQWAEVYDPIVE